MDSLDSDEMPIYMYDSARERAGIVTYYLLKLKGLIFMI